jgi:hypothetical protein
MSSSAPIDKDAAIKARIMKHMNADHQISLIYYLRHYASLSTRASRNAELTDMTFSSMTIKSASSELHTIPISPPLGSWADARPRVVEMDVAARRAMGISSISLAKTEYLFPTSPVHVIVFALCSWLYFSLVCQLFGFFAPGTFWYNTVLSKWPLGGAEWYLWIQKVIFIPVLLIHLGEASWMGAKLGKFGVEMDSALWWEWVSSSFVEGYGAHQRFDGIVKGKIAEAEKRKH